MTFEAWWAGKHGQTRDVSEAHYQMMRDAYGQGKVDQREACAAMLDAGADRQEAEWVEYLASGKSGPATSLHGIPRVYAAMIRKRSNKPS